MPGAVSRLEDARTSTTSGRLSSPRVGPSCSGCRGCNRIQSCTVGGLQWVPLGFRDVGLVFGDYMLTSEVNSHNES